MIEFSQAERQLLSTLRMILKKEETANHEALERYGKRLFDDELVDWAEAFESLSEKGLLQQRDDVYSLTSEGEAQAKEAQREQFSQGFADTLTRSELSKAYGTFCERVFGKNLCQFNMMDMEQLNKLLDVLHLDENCLVLDLGCGTGTITEYISDVTQAHLTGIDYAMGAIEQALRRTGSKRDRLSFREGDMNDLDYPSDSFDTIIAIDTLYFVDDLEVTLSHMKKILRPSGQMGLFYSQMIKPDESREVLLPEKTRLAQALKKHGLRFRVWDYTELEERLWQKGKHVAEELRSEFEAEGNLDLYRGRIQESEKLLKLVDPVRHSRFLYQVQL
ncbi:MAG: class I SAM-dependent methyltransferase [bacterium]